MHYPLRDVPDDLWKRARAKAARGGQTIRFVIIELLRRWVKGEVEL